MVAVTTVILVVLSSSSPEDNDVIIVTSLAGPGFRCVSTPTSLTEVSTALPVAVVITSPRAGGPSVEAEWAGPDMAEAGIGWSVSELLPLLLEAAPSGSMEWGVAVVTLGGVASVVLVMSEEAGMFLWGRRRAPRAALGVGAESWSLGTGG